MGVSSVGAKRRTGDVQLTSMASAKLKGRVKVSEEERKGF